MFDPELSPLSDTARRHSFCANPWTDAAETRHALLKVQAADYEFNIALTTSDVEQIQMNEPGEWESRGSMQIGKCMDSKVFWCIDGDDLSILIGQDDESWEVCFQLPSSALGEIRFALRELAPWLAGRSLPPGYAGHEPTDYPQVDEGKF